MRLVIPVSYHDQAALPDFITLLLKFGGLEKHHITFFPQLSQTQAAKEACARVLPYAANATVVAMENDLPTNNMPQSPNAQFAFAARSIANMPEQLMWLWMELDALPRKENWINEIESAVMRANTPFFGNIVPTPFLTEQGVWVTKPNDMMMMGVGVYHPQLINLIGLVNDLRVGPTGAPWAWGVYLRESMMNLGWTDTKLISDMNGTCNYRMEGESLVCDTAVSNPPRRPRSGAVNPEAVLVHGCKDDSLKRLLLGEIQLPEKSLKDWAEESTQLAAEIALKQIQENPSLVPVMSLAEAKKAMQAVSEAEKPDNSWLDDLGPDTPNVAEPVPFDEPGGVTHEWVNTQLAKGGLRIKAVCDSWKMTSDEVKMWLAQNGYTLSGPGWIKKARKK